MLNRIIEGVGGLYIVENEEGRHKCALRGRLRQDNKRPLVGDWVEMSDGAISMILPRKNELIRPEIANVDAAIIVMSIRNPDFSGEALDRYLAHTEHAGVSAAICINKSDLCAPSQNLRVYSSIGYPVFFICCLPEKELPIELCEFLNKKTSVLAGPSGAGKSSLINKLLGRVVMQEGELSKKTGRGKHTTRHTSLLRISNKTYLADAPGFSSLGYPNIPKEERGALFREFRDYTCRFSNCLHLTEPDCGIIPRVGKEISRERYERYAAWAIL